MKLSVIMPVFNEESTLQEIVQLVLRQEVVDQLIVVDDASTDRSLEILHRLKQIQNFDLIKHTKNSGKGACINSAIPMIRNSIVVIQDADLEYDPNYFSRLIKPIVENRADVVYGSRFQTGEERRVLYFWHSIGNRFLTLLSNAFTNINLTDMETCFKMMKTDLLKKIRLKEKRFGIEPEITAKLAKSGARFYEVSISYNGRTYEEGKKIRAKDGFRAIYCIVRYGLFR